MKNRCPKDMYEKFKVFSVSNASVPLGILYVDCKDDKDKPFWLVPPRKNRYNPFEIY